MKNLIILFVLFSTTMFAQKGIKTIMVNMDKFSVHEILSNGTDSVIRYTARAIESSNGIEDGSTVSFFTKDYTYIVESHWMGQNRKKRFITLVEKRDLWGNILYRQEYYPVKLSETSIVKN